jgi:hypothetical protein
MSERRGGWIRTYTGKKFYPLDPRPEEVDIYDIAHALSNLCRYGGHGDKFYSVAQHSVLVSEHSGARMWGLLHDAAEAYFCDMAYPVKHSPTIHALIKPIELKISRAIAAHFGLQWPEPASIKPIDNRICLDEKIALNLGSISPEHESLEPLGIGITPWPWELAEDKFLDRYFELSHVGMTA